ncbi:NADPH:quinone reductase [Micromonospora sp. NPDC049559]|uniref:NADPH:quinone reductase n=1 Tax=Micromonospora sp. NPDC049559 TaxID=3155923 RepID=UPI003417F5C7
MRAAWYDRQGPAAEVLQVGELPDPEPGEGEVRVRLTRSGVNPGDVKKRQGGTGSGMPYRRVVPHSDGAGVVDAVGPGADRGRVGQRVWVYGAQSYRPCGTAAEATVVPERLAVPLPDQVSDDVGASLGIPGITAHRAVFRDGPVRGKRVLVQGVLGAVGSLAAQLARWDGATVIGTVRRMSDVRDVPPGVADHVVALDGADPATQIRDLSGEGVDRIIEVALSANAELDSRVVAPDAVIAVYSSPQGQPGLPFWPLLYANATLRLLGSDNFPREARQAAVRDLTTLAAADALTIAIGGVCALEEVAAAHRAVESGSRGRILVGLS